MPSFQPPTGGAGFGGDFNFTAASTASNPFAQQNGTPPPTTFQFGQQNGASGSTFGSTGASFGSSFGGGVSQAPQQNGFNPSTSSIFANQSNNTASTPSFTFGQTNQSRPQQNGVTPSTATTSSFPSLGKQNENPFKNFSQSQQQTQSTPSTSFGGFGSQQTNGEKTPATPSFGGFGQQNQQTNGEKPSLLRQTSTPKPTTGSIFAGLGQHQLDGASKPDETPKPSTGSIFSGLQQNSSSRGLFGSTPPPEQTPKTGDNSVLTGLDPTRARSVTPGMFTQNRGDTPKPTTPFTFGQPQNGAGTSMTGAQDAPKDGSNLFSGAQTNGVKSSNFFGSTSTPAQPTPTKTTTSSIFSFGQQQQQSSSTPFSFGQSQSQNQQDTSMTTPGNTPQKASSMFTQASSQASAPSTATQQNETPVGQGKSLFDRISRDEPPTTAQKTSFTPSTSLFSQQPSSTPATNMENETPAANQGRSLFDRVSPADPPATVQKQQPSFTPSTNLFSQPAQKPADTLSAAPWLSHAPAPSPPATKVTPPTPQAPTTAKKVTTTSTSMEDTISDAEKGTFQLLNEGLMKHLATQDPNLDWTTIMQYYLQEAAKIRKKAEPEFDEPATATTTQPSAPAPSSSTGGSATGRSLFTPQAAVSQPTSSKTTGSSLFSPAVAPKAPAPGSANMFASANTQQTPKQPSSFQMSPSRPPATAPISRKRPGPFEDDDEDDVVKAPATEKRARLNEPIQYPKLPENATETAKLFQAALDKPAPKEPGTPGATATQAEKDNAETEKQSSSAPAFGGFKPSTSTSTGFKPSTPASTGFKPSVATAAAAPPAGMPTFSAPAASGGGFLAAFGKKASAEEEKQRKKRKMEDYDSDEETEEAWAKRDAEEQERKRKKILEAGKKASGFVPSATPSESGFRPSATPSESGFGRSATPSEAGDRDETPEPSNIFGSFGKPTSDKAAETSSIFKNFAKPTPAEIDKAEPEKEQGPGDNTWKPNTPIKFGAGATASESTTPAAPPPIFGNLFGMNTRTPGPSSSSLLNVPGAKPVGFNFGIQPFSQGTSRASTPGITTDGEGASTAGEGDDEEAPPAEPQADDRSALTAEEKEQNDVLFTFPNAKASRLGHKKDPETGEMKIGWVVEAEGPLYVLNDKNTGRTRVVLKLVPSGHPRMNFYVEKTLDFSTSGKKGQLVQGGFLDGRDQKNPKKPGRWLMDVKEKETADELLKILKDNRPTE